MLKEIKINLICHPRLLLEEARTPSNWIGVAVGCAIEDVFDVMLREKTACLRKASAGCAKRQFQINRVLLKYAEK